jgi:DMSO/TMAO reductase YedYZ molybdopterin-dependent catalytic subunit
MERRIRTADGLAAGAGATLVALAFLGLAHIVQASVPFPPAGIAQRVVQVMPGPLAVGAIELLGHWALRLFIIGVFIATVAFGAALGNWAANRRPAATWFAGVLLFFLALAGWQPGPGVDFLTYAVLCAIAAGLWSLQLRGSIGRLRAAAPATAIPAPFPADDMDDTEVARGRAKGPTEDPAQAPVDEPTEEPPGGPAEEPAEAPTAAATAAPTAAATTVATTAPAGAHAEQALRGQTRRELLRAGAGAGGLLLAGLVVRKVTGGFGDAGGRPIARPAGAPPVSTVAIPAEPEAQRAAFAAIEGLSPELTPNQLHYTVDESIIDPDVDVGDWRLRIDGLVGGPAELTYDDLLAMPAKDQIVTLVCISNYVGGDLVGTARWTGVRLADVLARAGGVKQGAVRVAFHAVGGYTDSLPVAKALDPATMVGYGMNGVALPRSHGYPARIIAPGIYGMKNVKWLERIEVVDYDFEGYWQSGGGWDNIATIQTESRIEAPPGGLGGGVAVVSGEPVIAGVAWAGDRGIQKVEASTDGGKTWMAAVLRRELAPAAWRQWYVRLPKLPSGVSTVLVRAYDGTGAVQTEIQAPPHPAGATGYDDIRIKG